MTSKNTNCNAGYTSALPRRASERSRYAADFLGEAFATDWRAQTHAWRPDENSLQDRGSLERIFLAAGKLSAALDAHDAATLMEGLKIGRRYGGALSADNYVDAAGYAALAAEIQLRLHPEEGEER